MNVLYYLIMNERRKQRKKEEGERMLQREREYREKQKNGRD